MRLLWRAVVLVWAALITVVVGWLAISRFSDEVERVNTAAYSPAVIVPVEPAPTPTASEGLFEPGGTAASPIHPVPGPDDDAVAGYEPTATPEPVTDPISFEEHQDNWQIALAWLREAFIYWQPEDLSVEPWSLGAPATTPWDAAAGRANAQWLADGGQTYIGDDLLRELSDRALRADIHPRPMVLDATELSTIQSGSGGLLAFVCIQWENTNDGPPPVFNAVAGEIGMVIADGLVRIVQLHPLRNRPGATC